MPLGYCSVPGCLTWEGNEARNIYRIPNARQLPSAGEQTALTPNATLQLKRRSQWLKALNIIPSSDCEKYVVCSRHFVSGKPAKVSQVQDVDWVPTLYLPDAETADNGAHKHINCLDETDENKDCLKELDVLSSSSSINRIRGSPQVLSEEDSCLKALGGNDQDFKVDHNELNKVLAENDKLSTRCRTLENQLHVYEMKLKTSEEDHRTILEKYKEGQLIIDRLRISENSFLGKDNKVQYMTGLPNYEVLMCLFSHVEDHIKVSENCALSKFQQFILTLMRLRLDLDFKFLGMYFDVSEPTASRVFYRIIHVLYVRLDFLITWPSRENLFHSMPLIFREVFGHKVALIIDCFEVYMERPSNILAASQVYSHYKSGNTVKFLIAICPRGAITFVSEGFGGRSSDKMVTERSKILENLIPGDVVLADKGFTIHDIVRECRAEIYMPAFKKAGVKQMSAIEVEQSRHVSNLRIHVERLIGVLKMKFKVWSSTLPIEFFHGDDGGPPVIDKMMRVCCALVNANASVVPLF